MFKSISDFNFEGKTLVLPSNSIGNAPTLGSDLYLITNNFHRVGYFRSKHIAYLVGSSLFDDGSSIVSLSSEGKVL